MDTGTFRLVRFDEEGGVRGTPENRRLVCVTDAGEKIAIWGSDRDRTNIDAVLSADLPCTIDCEWREPGDAQATRFGHRYWVRQDFKLVVRNSGPGEPGATTAG
jgi:hypothetical protein